MPTIKPITKKDYAHKYWKKSTDYQFTAGEALAPIVGQEMPRVAMVLPLAFTLDQEKKAFPVAVQGLKPGENLLVDENGKWRVGYVPAIYRNSPFSLGITEAGQQLLCINEDSGAVCDTGGEPFFAESGEPTEVLKQIFNDLHQLQQFRKATGAICEILQEYELIQPWLIKLQTKDGEKPLQGLYRIDEEKLNQLDDESFARIRKAGGLPLIYCQLLSMQHLPNLAKLAAKMSQKSVSNAVPDIEKLFGVEGDMFKFS